MPPSPPVRFLSRLGYLNGSLQRDFILYFIGGVFLKGLSFFLLPVYTRVFSPAEYGRLELLQSIGTIVDIVFTFGLAQFFYMEYNHCKNHSEKKDLLDRVLSLYLIFGSVFFFLFFAFVSHFGIFKEEGIGSSALGLLLVATFFNFFQNMLITVFRLRLQVKEVTFFQAMVGAGNLILILVLIWSGFKSITTVLFANFCISILSFVFGISRYLVTLKTRFRFSISRPQIEKFLFPAMLFIPNLLAFWVINNINRWIILEYSSQAEVGIYGIANKFGGLLEPLLVMPFANAYTPRALSALKDGTFKPVTVLNKFLALAGFVVAGFLLRYISYFFVGEEFQSGLILIPILAASSFFYLLCNITNVHLLHGRKTGLMLVSVLIGGISVVATNFLLVPHYGGLGAAISALAGNAAWYFSIYFFSIRLHKKSGSFKNSSPS
ncbi:MAG: lipopolysaccharide biosynthesis protein [Bacteroidota bacterium]